MAVAVAVATEMEMEMDLRLRSGERAREARDHVQAMRLRGAPTPPPSSSLPPSRGTIGIATGQFKNGGFRGGRPSSVGGLVGEAGDRVRREK